MKKLSIAKLFIQGILLFTLLALGIMILYYFGNLTQLTLADIRNTLLLSFIFFGILLLLPLIYFVFTFSIFRKTFQTKDIVPLVFKNKLKRVNILLFSLIIIFDLIIVFVVGAVAYDAFTEKPPQFFPLNDTHARYTIKVERHQDGLKEQSLYFILYDTTKPTNTDFCTNEYEKHGIKHCSFQGMIGDSPIDLQQFVDKDIMVEGEFVNRGTQCIAKKCIDIGRYAAFDIKDIRLK